MSFLFGNSPETASEANARDARKTALAAHPPSFGAGNADAASGAAQFMGASPERLKAASPSAQPSEFDMSPADLKRSEDTSSGEHPAGTVGAEPKPSVTERAKGILSKAKPAAPASTGDDIQSPVMLDDTSPMPPQPQEAPKHDYELEDAMRRTNMRHKIGQVFQLFGINPANMDQPMQELEQKRTAEREHFQDTVMQDQYDPASRPSKLLQAVAMKKYHWSPEDAQGLTASDQKLVEAGYNADQVREARKDMMREKKYEADAREREANQRDVTTRRGQDLEYRAKIANEGNKNRVPPHEFDHLEALDEADKTLDTMPELHGQSDLGAYLRWRDTQVINNAKLSSRLGKPLMDRIANTLPGKLNIIGIGGSRMDAWRQAKEENAQERETLLSNLEKNGYDTTRWRNSQGASAAAGRPPAKHYVKTAQGWVEQ